MCNERKDFKSVTLDVKIDDIKEIEDKQYELTYSMTYKTNYTNGKAERVLTFQYNWLAIKQDKRVLFNGQKKQKKLTII
ncbi:hypothetical protein VK90_03335 [Bacillus sp. LK2]|nr:hypothetical protein VK90_03335 [Bacillus sp. LK2]